MRAAFTLIEVLVALILFEIGMLALAGVAAVAARDLAIANRSIRAQTIAGNRLELLRSVACLAPATGQAQLPGGFIETWHVEVDRTLRRITTSVEFPRSDGRLGRVSVATSAVCAS